MLAMWHRSTVNILDSEYRTTESRKFSAPLH